MKIIPVKANPIRNNSSGIGAAESKPIPGMCKKGSPGAEFRENRDTTVSFKGAPFLHKAAKFTTDNPLVAESLFAILITCGLRPLTIMATAKTEEEKEKCSYQAAKSISSGLVGLATTALVSTPIVAAIKCAQARGAFKIPPHIKEEAQKAIDPGLQALKEKAGEIQELAGVKIAELIEGNKLNLNVFKKAGKNAEKNFISQIREKLPDVSEDIVNALKEQRVLDNYARTNKNVADKMFQPIFMPLRATATVALVPVLLGLVGLKKSDKKPSEKPEQKTQAPSGGKSVEKPDSGLAAEKTSDVKNPYENLNISAKNYISIFKEFSGE